MKPVVYIDLLFLINFLMDSVIIYAASLMLKRSLKISRLFFSACVSAVYSAVMFFPQLTILFSLIFKIVFFILPSIIAFPTKDVFLILKNTIILSVSYAAFGGVMFFLIFATNFGTSVGAAVSNGEIYINISSVTLVISTIFAYLMVYIMSFVNHKGINLQKKITKANICYEGKTITVNALMDTGCSLTDPLSGKPVFIISPGVMKDLTTMNLAEFKNKNCHTIPFSTIENSNGTMFGFIAEYIAFENLIIKSAIVGISPICLNSNSEFDAIFNPEILKNFKEIGCYEAKTAN